jgi:hypothetical protein
MCLSSNHAIQLTNCGPCTSLRALLGYCFGSCDYCNFIGFIFEQEEVPSLLNPPPLQTCRRYTVGFLATSHPVADESFGLGATAQLGPFRAVERAGGRPSFLDQSWRSGRPLGYHRGQRVPRVFSTGCAECNSSVPSAGDVWCPCALCGGFGQVY